MVIFSVGPDRIAPLQHIFQLHIASVDCIFRMLFAATPEQSTHTPSLRPCSSASVVPLLPHSITVSLHLGLRPWQNNTTQHNLIPVNFSISVWQRACFVYTLRKHLRTIQISWIKFFCWVCSAPRMWVCKQLEFPLFHKPIIESYFLSIFVLFFGAF